MLSDKPLPILCLLFSLVACGDNNKTQSSGIDDPCQLLTPEMITAQFPNATQVQQNLKERTYPSCTTDFTVADDQYRVNLTVAPGFGSQAGLERAVAVFDNPAAVEDLGDGAFYVEGSVNQVSVWAGEHLFHLAFHRNNTGDRAQAIALARQALKQF